MPLDVEGTSVKRGCLLESSPQRLTRPHALAARAYLNSSRREKVMLSLLDIKGGGLFRAFRPLLQDKADCIVPRFQGCHWNGSYVLNAALLIRLSNLRRGLAEHLAILAEFHDQLGSCRDVLVSICHEVERNTASPLLLVNNWPQ